MTRIFCTSEHQRSNYSRCPARWQQHPYEHKSSKLSNGRIHYQLVLVGASHLPNTVTGLLSPSIQLPEHLSGLRGHPACHLVAQCNITWLTSSVHPACHLGLSNQLCTCFVSPGHPQASPNMVRILPKPW